MSRLSYSLPSQAAAAIIIYAERARRNGADDAERRQPSPNAIRARRLRFAPHHHDGLSTRRPPWLLMRVELVYSIYDVQLIFMPDRAISRLPPREAIMTWPISPSYRRPCLTAVYASYRAAGKPAATEPPATRRELTMEALAPRFICHQSMEISARRCCAIGSGDASIVDEAASIRHRASMMRHARRTPRLLPRAPPRACRVDDAGCLC